MQSINLTTAFILSQVLLLAIVFAGIALLRAGESRHTIYSGQPKPATHFYPMLFGGFALVTFAALAFSEDVLSTSQPVFKDISLPSLSRDIAFLFVFALDLIGATYLIWITGGSRNSPFASLLFFLPTLAIFLREPPQRFLSYAFAAAILFILAQMDRHWPSVEDNPYNRRAHTVVSLGCLALSTMAGYATRPM
jgi:hypothetical protein